MSEPNEPGTDPAGLRGPGDPDAVEARQPHAEPGQAGNIREEQLTQAAGTVPAYWALGRGAAPRLYFGAGPSSALTFLPPALAFALSARSFFFASASALPASLLSSFAMTL